MAVMSRAALGHTGRALEIGAATVAAYALVTAGALLRVVVPPLLPAYYNEGMLAAGASWIAAFAIFAIVYWPVLTGPRVGRDG